MTTVVNGRPKEQDAIPVLNKVTLAAGTEREVTILLKPHIGKIGREKDGRIIAYMMNLGDNSLDDVTVLMKFASDPEFIKIAQIVLDLDDEEGEEIMESMTLFEMADAFRQGMDYRTNQVKREDVQDALGKSRGDESLEVTNL